ALVVRGVVDEDRDRSESLAQALDRAAQGRDVREVSGLETHLPARRRQLLGEAPRFGLLDVDEADGHVLLGEAANDPLADARAAAGHERYLAREIGIDRRHFRSPPCWAKP